MANLSAPTEPEPLWRRALRALARIFDPASEDRFDDTVFQPRPARQKRARR
jgi:hypothetical protein